MSATTGTLAMGDVMPMGGAKVVACLGNGEPFALHKDDFRWRDTAVNRALARLVNDPRDVVMLRKVVLLLTTVVVPGVLFFTPLMTQAPAWVFWPAALFYMLNTVFFRTIFFINVSHWNAHRPIVKKGERWMDFLLRWVTGFFFGLPGQVYYMHHLGIHHPGKNLDDDLSSTVRYRRNSLPQFVAYLAEFILLQPVRIPLAFMRRGEPRRALKFIVSEYGFWLATVLLAVLVDWRAAVMVLVLPYLLVRWLLMSGNWVQHGFLDARDPAHPWRFATTVVNCDYNLKSFNDGFHLMHHQHPGQHWSEMPGAFERELPLYREHDAVVFAGIDFFRIWIALMLNDYEKLADHYVNLRPGERSRADIVALLKERTQNHHPRAR